LGKALWQIDQMPARELAEWRCYHEVRGLPCLEDLVSHLCLVVEYGNWSGRGRKPSIDNHYLRPQRVYPKSADDEAMAFERAASALL
jgi:hypothetical protein